MQLIDTSHYDELLGSSGDFVVCGENAFMRVGLTTLWMDTIKAWTPYSEVHGIATPYVQWYYNSDAKNIEDTKPSTKCTHIHEPTRERAIVEYIKFREYFDEGILVEGIDTYLLFNKDSDLSELYRIADKYKLPKSELDYWLNEARNDREV